MRALAALLLLAGCVPVPPGALPTSPRVPEGSSLLVPVAGHVSSAARAPDGRQIAYVQGGTSSQTGTLHVAEPGGRDRAFNTTLLDVSSLCWGDQGQSVLYLDREERVDPTRFDDQDLPHRETVAYRLRRVWVDTGTLETLAEGLYPFPFQAAPLGHLVAWHDGKSLILLDMSGKRSQPNAVLGDYWTASADGGWLAYVAAGEVDHRDRPLVIEELATGQRATTGSDGIGALVWLGDGRLQAFESARTLVFDRQARPVQTTPCDLGGDAWGLGARPLLSPNEAWMLAANPTNRAVFPHQPCGPARPAITGTLGWWNDEALLGGFESGLYAVPIPPPGPMPVTIASPSPGVGLPFGGPAP